MNPSSKQKSLAAIVVTIFTASLVVYSGALNPTSSVDRSLYGTFTSNSADLSTSVYFPPIGDQVSNGACTSWAFGYYAFGYMLAKQQDWRDTSAGNPEHLVSVNFIFNKITSTTYFGGDTGSSFNANTQFLLNWGAASMASVPYSYKDIKSWGNETAMDEAGNYKITGSTLIRYSSSTVQEIKNKINNYTPVVFAMNANVFQTYYKDGGHVVSAYEYDFTTTNHAQTIIGYDDNVTDDNEFGAFKVANSWGEGFGEDGFYWITYDCIREIGLTTWGGSFTYLKVSSNPVKQTLRADIITAGNVSMKTVVNFQMYDSNGKLVKTKVLYYNSNQRYGDRMLPEIIHYDLSEFYSPYKTGKYSIKFTLSNPSDYSKIWSVNYAVI
jgi:hypothetical protein